MTTETLGIIDKALTDAGIRYEYDRWTSDIAYPYWVGEYSEREPISEDGLSETTFILAGFTRGNPLELEQEKEKIRQLFNPISGLQVIADSGAAVAIFYSSSVHVPIENDDLKSIQITLLIKEWRVN